MNYTVLLLVVSLVGYAFTGLLPSVFDGPRTRTPPHDLVARDENVGPRFTTAS